jgi:hypothetical protein
MRYSMAILCCHLGYPLCLPDLVTGRPRGSFAENKEHGPRSPDMIYNKVSASWGTN